MVIDKISQKALESLLQITFNSNTEHYPVVSKAGLAYELIQDIEIKSSEIIHNVFSPFATFISKKSLENKVNSYKEDTLSDQLNSLKIKSLFSFFKKVSSKKDNLVDIVDTIDKCMTDELIKSQKLLEHSEIENPSLLLLMKGIKNLENPDNINGLSKKSIQEIGALQIGMAINDMKDKTPMMFRTSLVNSAFKYELNKIQDSNFIKQCCFNAKSKQKNIIELTVASKRDPHFDAHLNNNDQIDYSHSFKDLDVLRKHNELSKIKDESVNILSKKALKYK